MAVVVDVWSTAKPVPRQSLIDRVCALYGFDSADATLALRAVEALDETINDLNAHLFYFSLASQPAPLIAGQPYVELGDQVYRVNLAYLVDQNGKQLPPLEIINWLHFQRFYGDSTITGIPMMAAFNYHAGDPRINLYPTPTASEATTLTLYVEYYQRIPLVSTLGLSDSLDCPPEIESALLWGARKRMAAHLKGMGDPDVARAAQMEEKALERLEAMDRNWPAQRNKFMVWDFARTGLKQATRPGWYNPFFW